MQCRLVGRLLAPLLVCAGNARAEVPPAKGGDPFAAARERMVTEQIVERGVADPRVLRAIRRVPRHLFVPEALREVAYDDRPLPISDGQTISQPYVVALMTELAEVRPGARVLEIGTGSGYQAAVLAELGAEVFTIEIVERLGQKARDRLRRLGYRAVTVKVGDGFRGWPDKAPFDAIVVTAAPPEVPQPLLRQLKVGGHLVIPVGEEYQELLVVERRALGYQRRSVVPVAFVPMTGEARESGRGKR
jgi:protein-L-isoaspartate(D-aspartate) O-methyltransferase